MANRSSSAPAPILSVILMILVLEFVEWYGEGKWIETYLLEEGNKSYFIAFMSFCLGLTSERTGNIMGDLAESVGDFVEGMAKAVGWRLRTVFSNSEPGQK